MNIGVRGKSVIENREMKARYGRGIRRERQKDDGRDDGSRYISPSLLSNPSILMDLLPRTDGPLLCSYKTGI